MSVAFHSIDDLSAELAQPASAFTKDLVEETRGRISHCYEMADLEPADIVLFRSNSHLHPVVMFLQEFGYRNGEELITHVAIHIGRGRIIHNNLVYPAISFGEGFRIQSGVHADLLHAPAYLKKEIAVLRNPKLSEFDKRSVTHFAAQRLKGSYDMFPLVHAFMLKMNFIPTGPVQSWIEGGVLEERARQCLAAARVCSSLIEECFTDALGSTFSIVGDPYMPFPLPPDFLKLPDFQQITPKLAAL